MPLRSHKPSQNKADPGSISAGIVSSGLGLLVGGQRCDPGITLVAPFASVLFVPATAEFVSGRLSTD